MKSYLKAATAALLSFAAMPAMASDLPAAAPTPVLEAPVPVGLSRPSMNLFEGFFIGGHAGAAIRPAQSYRLDNAPFAPPGFQAVFPGRGGASAVFGAVVGYNWQAGPFLWGAELMGEFSPNARHWSSPVVFDDGTTTLVGSSGVASSVDGALQSRVKLGYSFAPTWALYGLAGLGIDFRSYQYQEAGLRIATPAWARSKATPATWGVGAGVEWMSMGNVSLRGEYEYRRAFSNHLWADQGENAGRHILRVGANYYFR